MFRNVLRQTGSFLLTFTLIVGIIEFTVRSFVLMRPYDGLEEWRYRTELVRFYLFEDQSYMVRNIPNFEGTVMGHSFKTDEYGFRREVGTAPSNIDPKKKTIMLMGNSTAMG